MRVLVINLDAQEERRAFQSAQLDRLGLTMERISAIDQRHPDVCIPSEYWESWQRPLSLPERACLLSHRQAWERVASGNEPCLILEDDALLSEQTPAILNALSAWPVCFEHVTLEARNRKKLLGRQSIALTEHSQLRRLFLDRTGAAAYVLSPSGAERLIKTTEKQAGLADAIICSTPGLISYQVFPAAAIQLDQCRLYGIACPLQTQSNILTSQKNLPQKDWKQRLRRIAAQLEMGWRQFKHTLATSREHVPVNPQDF
jgi:glycosyl transferase family 25